MITDFPIRPLFNVGGVAAFQFSPYSLVAQPLPIAPGKLITSPVTFSGDNTFLIGYSTLGMLKFTETSKLDANGVYYDWKITGFTPGDSDHLADLMEEMELVRHLVLITDQNNLLKLVGANAPLDFTADFSPGDDPSGSRGYSFTFTGIGRKRAPVYQPA